MNYDTFLADKYTFGEHIAGLLGFTFTNPDELLVFAEDFIRWSRMDDSVFNDFVQTIFLCGEVRAAITLIKYLSESSYYERCITKTLSVRQKGASCSLQLRKNAAALKRDSKGITLSILDAKLPCYVALGDFVSIHKGDGAKLLQMVKELKIPVVLYAGALKYGYYLQGKTVAPALVRYYEQQGFVNVNAYCGDCQTATPMLFDPTEDKRHLKIVTTP